MSDDHTRSDNEAEGPAEEPADGQPPERGSWLAGRKVEVERWVEEACEGAIARARGVVADEIRTLSRRVERLHEVLDRLEQVVETPDGDPQSEPGHADGEGDG